MKLKNNNEFHFLIKLKLQFDFAHVFESLNIQGITIEMLTVSILTVNDVLLLFYTHFIIILISYNGIDTNAINV